MINRRTFFSQSALSLSLIALPALVQASTVTRRYKLTANRSNVSFDGKGEETSLWPYNKTTPGPLLKARRGEIIEAEFINRLDHPSTIHWHGICNINEMDVFQTSRKQLLSQARHLHIVSQLMMRAHSGITLTKNLGNK